MSMRVGSPTPGGQLVHGARRGPPPGLNVRRGGKQRRAKKKNSNLRKVVLVVAIAFLFVFTPAEERISNQLEKWLDDLLDEFGPAREYPVHAVYTVERQVNLGPNLHQTVTFNYELPIPALRSDFGIEDSGFTRQDGTVIPVVALQEVVNMVAYIDGTSNNVSIPLNNEYLLGSEAIALDSNSEIFWPPIGGNSDRCSVTKCAIWRGEIPAGQILTLKIKYDVVASSFSWWGGERAPDKAPKSQYGFSMHDGNAGTYDDYDRSGRLDTMYDQFGAHKLWYDRSTSEGTSNWAIDGLDSNVIELADEIQSSLDASESDSPYSFAHAAFIKIRDSIVYSDGLKGTARSGPACILDGRGDCDEQSNAWMSLLRTRNIPAWYEFGPMTSGEFGAWEAHAWANAIFPFDEEWCNENDIELSSCFVEGEVDVVNNRWLLHTPTTLTEWIEDPSNLGQAAYDFYRPLSISCSFCWTESWETIGEPQITGGTYRVPVRIGE